MKPTFTSLFLSLAILGTGLLGCKQEKKAPITPKPKSVTAVKKATKPEPKETEPQPQKAPNKYFLIGASFQNSKNAQLYRQKLQNKGFESSILEANNGFSRVSYKGFSDRKEAFKQLRADRSTTQYKDVWLHIKH